MCRSVTGLSPLWSHFDRHRYKGHFCQEAGLSAASEARNSETAAVASATSTKRVVGWTTELAILRFTVIVITMPRCSSSTRRMHTAVRDGRGAMVQASNAKCHRAVARGGQLEGCPSETYVWSRPSKSGTYAAWSPINGCSCTNAAMSAW